MKKIHFLVALIFLAWQVPAQEPWHLVLSSVVEKDERGLGGATIELLQGNVVVKKGVSAHNGYFSMDVPANGDYILRVSYEKCNSKIFSVSTKNVPEEIIQRDRNKPTMKIDGVTMKRPLYSIDYSALKLPMAKILYDPDEKKFGHDEAHTERMLNALDAIREAERILLEKRLNAIKAGDIALKKNDCPLAKINYQKAISLIPEEPYHDEPKLKLSQADKCILEKQGEDAAKAAKEKQAAELAAKAAADAKAREEADKKAAAEQVAKQKAEAEAKVKADAAAKIEKEKADKQAAEMAANAAKEQAARAESERRAKAAAEQQAKAEAENAARAEAEKSAEMAAAKARSEAEAKVKAEMAAKAEQAKLNEAQKIKADLAAKAAADQAEKATAEAKAQAEAAAKAEAEGKRRAAADEAAANAAKERSDMAAKAAAEKAANDKIRRDQATAQQAAKNKAEKEQAEKAKRESDLAEKERARKASESQANESAADVPVRDQATSPGKDEGDRKKPPSRKKSSVIIPKNTSGTPGHSGDRAVSKSDQPGDPGDRKKRNRQHSIPQTLGGGAEKYREAIREADDYFKMKRYEEARSAYQEALKYKEGDAYATRKLADIAEIQK